jgi:acetyl-CoA synthetase
MDQPVAMQAGRDVWWHDIAPDDPGDVPTAEMDAEDPFMLYFTSGTTGKAKGTVHTHCGFVAKMAADFGLVLDLKPEDRWLWISDIGWVVGALTAVSVPLMGGTVVMAEGTPDYPEPGRMWRLVQDHKVSYLGVAPTTVRGMMRYGAEEVAKYDLSSIRVTASSGELWNPDSWQWFMDHVCKGKAPILNLSGGTEIGCGIISSTVIHPAKPCAFTGSMPGMGADIVDANGDPVPAGVTGELVLRVPSIGLTRGLWHDNDRYLETYWNRIPGLWVHGDWASRDEDGMWYLHGRSDETIMVAGKRCGPSEVESLVMNSGVVAEVAAAGVHDALKGEMVFCACVPAAGAVDEFDADTIRDRVRDAVVAGLGPAFRPGAVVLVSQLPKTRNMKILRRVVKAVYMGREPGDLASLVNPEAVDELRAVVER